jgi:hypothetical protein
VVITGGDTLIRVMGVDQYIKVEGLCMVTKTEENRMGEKASRSILTAALAIRLMPCSRCKYSLVKVCVGGFTGFQDG